MLISICETRPVYLHGRFWQQHYFLKRTFHFGIQKVTVNLASIGTYTGQAIVLKPGSLWVVCDVGLTYCTVVKDLLTKVLVSTIKVVLIIKKKSNVLVFTLLSCFNWPTGFAVDRPYRTRRKRKKIDVQVISKRRERSCTVPVNNMPVTQSNFTSYCIHLKWLKTKCNRWQHTIRYLQFVL